MDILLRLKNGIDAVLWEILDRRILLSILRLTSICVDSLILLHLSARLFRPVQPPLQWFAAIAGAALGFATRLDGISHVRRGLMLWVVLAATLALLYTPRAIAKSLTPSIPGRARIKRALYFFIVGTLLAQLVVI